MLAVLAPREGELQPPKVKSQRFVTTSKSAQDYIISQR